MLRHALFEALSKTIAEGMACSAVTRTGKSSMTKALEKTFIERRSAFCIRRQCVNVREKKVANHFLRRLRGDEAGPDARAVHSNPFLALKNHCLNECDKLDTDTVVICLDEAQNLSLEELDVLMVLTADLDDLGLRPFVLLIGQPELGLLRQSLLDWSRPELVARWMGSYLELPGFDASDLLAMGTALDTLTWPPGSDITYTQHYLPELWKKGWRTADHCAQLWEAMKTLATETKMKTHELEIGGEYARSAFLALLLHLRKNPQDLATRAFSEAARLSRMTDAAKVRIPTKKDEGMLRAVWMRKGLQRK